jgi:hypothetical protein
MTVRTLRATARAGYSVVTASDLEEAACGTACAEIPDLILLDMLLSNLGGGQRFSILISFHSLCVCCTRCRASGRVGLKVSREGRTVEW